MESFQAVYKYLENLKKILLTPNICRNLFLKTYQCKSLLCQINPLSIKTSTQVVDFNPFSCTSKLIIEQYKLEIQYIDKVLQATYRKFLTAIDHTDYHPSQVQNTTRTKRSEDYAIHGYYCSGTRTLAPSEEIFLDKFLIALQRNQPLPSSRSI